MIGALAEAFRARRTSPVEAVQECLDRIRRLDGRFRAFIRVDGDAALAAARTATEALLAGRDLGPLHGIPLAYKDLVAVDGFPTSGGSANPEYFLAAREATAVARLRRAGAVVLGKLNLSELALGPFGDNAHHGDARNPWDPGHVAGGSSSGSGVAVAAGLAGGALGTDTGGSIRLPAACCGIVGLKPTYGRVSRAGVMPLSWSLDHVGPMARTVRDAALLLGVIAGADRDDATASARPVPDYAAGLARPIRGLRIGVPESYYWDGIDAEMAAGVRAAIDVLARLGAEPRELALPDPQILVDVGNVLARCESAAVHTRLLREAPHQLQPAVRARLEVGLHVSAHDYLQAARLRARLARSFLAEAFADADVLLAPVIPEPAPRLDAVKAGSPEEIVRRMGRFSRLTRPFNTLGLPALSVPCGFSRPAGLPLAFQVVGRPFDEATVLRVGYAYEQAAGWADRRPSLD